MSEIGSAVSSAGIDHRIDQAEAKVLVQQANGHGNLVEGFKEQGFDALHAETMANRMETMAHSASPEPAMKVAFAGLDPTDFAGNPAAQQALIEQSPQVNPVSESSGLSNDCCGGASVMNAMVLTSGSKAEAATNAQAISDTAMALKVQPTPEEERSLQQFRAGRASPVDMQRLQGLLYRMGRATDPSVPGKGMNDGQMATLTTMLRARGAFGTHEVDFHGSRPKGGRDHWTVSVDGKQHANSADAKSPTGASQTGLPDFTKTSHDTWTSTIHSTPAQTTCHTIVKNPPKDGPAKLQEIYEVPVMRPPQALDDLVTAVGKANAGAKIEER